MKVTPVTEVIKYNVELTAQEFMVIAAAVGSVSGYEASEYLRKKNEAISPTDCSNILMNVFDYVFEMREWELE